MLVDMIGLGFDGKRGCGRTSLGKRAPGQRAACGNASELQEVAPRKTPTGGSLLIRHTPPWWSRIFWVCFLRGGLLHQTHGWGGHLGPRLMSLRYSNKRSAHSIKSVSEPFVP